MLCPLEVWVHQQPRRLTVELAGEGIVAVEEVLWTGTAEGHAGPTATITIPAGTAGLCALGLRAHVKTADARTVLTATHTLSVRRPCLTIDTPRQRIVLADQDGEPGRGVTLQIEGAPHTTTASGLITLSAPLPPNAAVQLETLRLVLP